jgi:parvulin-like peptidyl-prolyl isomerase
LARKKNTPATHNPSKRQLSHWQKQKRQQQYILVIGIAVITIVFVLLGLGGYQWYKSEYKPLSETVIEVNGQKFNMAYYIDALQYYSGGQTSYIEYLLDPVLENIGQLELMRQEAEKLGFVIAEEDINQTIKENELENIQAIRDIVRGQLLSKKLQSEYFDPQIPVSAEQCHAIAMFLESQNQLDSIRAKIESGEDWGTIAAASSLDPYSKSNNGDIGTHPKGIINDLLDTTVLEDAVFNQQPGILAQIEDENKTKSTGYWLVKVTERKEDLSEATVYGMLLSSEQEALEIKGRLNNGEDFSALAEEYSQIWSTTNGALLGSITTESSDSFKEYVLSADTPLNTVSDPIKCDRTTAGGYWLYEVLDKSVQDISEDDRSTLTQELFSNWITEIQDDPDNVITNYITEGLKTFAATKAMES